MSYDEALAWLRGERSTANYWRSFGLDDREVHLARNDAAMCEQAYWVVRAHHEGLMPDEDGE